ncbi:hypothetical protein [Stenotrophomonas rhizophila]|uniref:hypothetical protein n=1 Tax=Stenotrophomonas rhizophila TaxID=216778 RepID=UPI0028AEB383|nr:hypothetical protein [Stenotrophomonas rhizophila]
MSAAEFEELLDAYFASAGLERLGFDSQPLKDFVLQNTVPKVLVAEKMGELKEELAAIEHERWAHWQSYMHSKCHRQEGLPGALVIPAELVDKWERQAGLAFSELNEDERESDREQVDRYLPLIVSRLSA